MTRTELHRLQEQAIHEATATATRLQKELALSNAGVLGVLDRAWFPWLAMSAAVGLGAVLAF